MRKFGLCEETRPPLPPLRREEGEPPAPANRLQGLFECDEGDDRGGKRRATGAAPPAVLQIDEYPLYEMFLEGPEFKEMFGREREPTDPTFETGGDLFSHINAPMVKVKRKIDRDDGECGRDDDLVLTDVTSLDDVSPWMMETAKKITIFQLGMEPFAEQHSGIERLMRTQSQGGIGAFCALYERRGVASLGFNTKYNRTIAIPAVSALICAFITFLELFRVMKIVGMVYYLLNGFHHMHGDNAGYDERAVVNMGRNAKTFHLRCGDEEYAFRMKHGTVVVLDRELGVNKMGKEVLHGAFGDPSGTAIVIIDMKKKKR